MLDGGRQKALGLQLSLFALPVGVSQGQACRALDLDAEVRDRQAAFLVQPRLRAESHDLRIDQHQRLRLLVLVSDIEHDQAARHADLNGGQPDARRRVHRLQHVVGQPAQLVVDAARRASRACAARDPEG